MNEETLFEQALALAPEGRPAFLDSACASRPELRAAVEALLAAHDKPGNLLDRPPDRTVDSGPGDARPDATLDHTPEPDDEALAATRTADYRPLSGPGVIIAGHYALEQKIGEGGMGEVWVARQTEPVKRRVALKLIKAGMDSRAVVQRFEQERQALALMDHPNIAKVLDGGLTPGGQPFFVMELVNGLPLTKFCDEARLTTEARLELFVAICQAVQHAHQKGVVHRDLKPANILVTMIDGRPVPKVIDFGVAKATAGKITDVSLSTQFGSVVGTLEYMAPEQAGFSGVDVDTRADIYSLGVILYELLTGLRPIDAGRLRAAAITEMIRIIREEEPLRPSTRLSTDESLASMAALRQIEPRKLMALLRGELDWVVMKCLEKSRDRRYETANGLARDVRRYLDDEPVEARPPSAGYRLGKLVRRHRGKVIAAVLVLLALVAGMAGTTWGLIREARANTALAAKNAELSVANGRVLEANAELVSANAKVEARYKVAFEAIKTFHTGVSEDFLLKEEQFKELRDRLLKSAADFYGRLGALLGAETDFASRRALAASNFELADLTGQVGSKEDALRAHRAVLAAREALAAEPGTGGGAKVDVGRSLTEVARLLQQVGKTDEALATLHRAESLLASQAGADREAQGALADCRSLMGHLLDLTNKNEEALAAYRLARAAQESLATAPDASKAVRSNLAKTILRMGFRLQRMGKVSEAAEEYRKLIAILQKLSEDNPKEPEFRKGLSGGLEQLATVLRASGKSSEAEAELRRALEIQRELVDDNPAVTDFRGGLASSHNNLGALLGQMGRLTEAEAEFRRALELLQKLAADNPAATKFRRNLASSHHFLGTVLRLTGKSSEAEAELRRALAIREKLADDHPAVTDFRGDLALSHDDLGSLLRDTGKPTEAEAELRRALAILQKLADDHPAVAEFRNFLAGSHNNLGLLLGQTGKLSEAEAEYRRALAIRAKLSADNPTVTEFRVGLSYAHNNLADVLRSLGRVAEARDGYDRTIALKERRLREAPANPRSRYDLAWSLRRRGLARRDLGDLAGAAADARRALALWEGLPSRAGGEWFETACVRAALADLAGRAGSGISAVEAASEADTAMSLLRKAVDMGYRSPAAFRAEAAIDPLRQREDFQKLLAELQQVSAPKPAKSP